MGRKEEERRLQRSGADAATFFKPLFPASSETRPFPGRVSQKPAGCSRSSVFLTAHLRAGAVSVHLLFWWGGKQWREGRRYFCRAEASG